MAVVMCDPPLASNERARLLALRSYGILDTPSEGAFDDITRIAALICDAPIAVVNFIDEGRQWFKSEIGLGVRETPLGPSICAHAILQLELFVVPDTTLDDRFRDNPLVTGDPKLRFYAGAPLLTPDGLSLGTVCVLDTRPRELTEEQQQALRALARQAMAQLELRKALKLAEASAQYRRQILAIVGHDLKSPLRAGSYAVARAGRGVEAGSDIDKRLQDAAKAFATIDAEFNTLVALATVDDANAVPRLSAFALAEVLEPLVATWSVVASRKGLALTISSSSCEVLSQRELLGTILGNLLSNAVKYTVHGEIRIDCAPVGNDLVITVADTGIGIEQNRIGGLFEAFQQVDGATEGLGLGMWIVSRTASMLGHHIEVQSDLGHGSRFSISVPRNIVPAAVPDLILRVSIRMRSTSDAKCHSPELPNDPCACVRRCLQLLRKVSDGEIW